MSSLWSKVARVLPFKRNRPVGYDLQGNKYFEHPDANGGRDRRVVEYADDKGSITGKGEDYRKGTAQLPVQWTAWMSYTRELPPTMAELQVDAARQSRLQPLIAAIEAREKAERIEQGYLLPDGSEPPRSDMDARVPASLSFPGRSGPGANFLPGEGRKKLVMPPREVAQAAGFDTSLAPPRATVDPASADDAAALRKLAEDDTRRRLRESGVAESSGQVDGVTGVGRAFKPARRRG